jgi:hypothetical protein
MWNQFLSRLKKPNSPLVGQSKTNDDELDKYNGWQRNTGEWKQGDNNTEVITETKLEKIFSTTIERSCTIYEYKNVHGEIAKCGCLKKNNACWLHRQPFICDDYKSSLNVCPVSSVHIKTTVCCSSQNCNRKKSVPVV